MLSLSALCEEIAIELNGTRAGISLKTDLARSSLPLCHKSIQEFGSCESFEVLSKTSKTLLSKCSLTPKSRMLVENDFGPAEAAGRSQTRPVEA